MNNMKYVVKLLSFDIALMIISLIPISIMPHIVGILVKYFVVIYLLLKYLSWNNIKHNKVIITLIPAYTVVLTYSTYINTADFAWTLSAFMTGMQYLAMFLLFYSVAKRRGLNALAKDLLIIIGTLILLNDIIMPFVEFHSTTPNKLYLLGNKFFVIYLHSIFGVIAYVLQKGKFKKVLYVICFVFLMLLSKALDTSTGIVINAAIIPMICFPSITQRIVNIPIAFPIALCIENILIWGSANLFKQPWLMEIMTDVLNESSNMSGREQLYSITLMSVAEKPLFGYGHLTNLYRDIFDYGNAQNGLFHIVTQGGIIGAVIYFSMITYALINKKKDNHTYGLYMFVYAMLLGSAVEINLNDIFLIAVATIYAFQRTPSNNEIIERA